MSFMAATYRLCSSALGQQLRRSASAGRVRSDYAVSYAAQVLRARACSVLVVGAMAAHVRPSRNVLEAIVQHGEQSAHRSGQTAPLLGIAGVVVAQFLAAPDCAGGRPTCPDPRL